MQVVTSNPGKGVQFEESYGFCTQISSTALAEGEVCVLDIAQGTATTIDYGTSTSVFSNVDLPATGAEQEWGIYGCNPRQRGTGSLAQNAVGRIWFAGKLELTINNEDAATVVAGSPAFPDGADRNLQVSTTSGVDRRKVVAIILEDAVGATAGLDSNIQVLFDGVNGFGHITTVT